MTPSIPDPSPGRKVAIVQSSYIPWKGYFDLMHAVDEFILYDDVQFTRRDWRNRNRIKTKDGPQWLTIPVAAKGNYLAAIRNMEIADGGWAASHWKGLQASYARAPHFREYEDRIHSLYFGPPESRLSAVNRRFIEGICELLGIHTRLSWSWDYELVEGKTERLVALCRQAGAAAYVSGPTARGYIDPALFAEAGIALSFFDYSGYPEYPQLHPPFDHHVTILDLLFHMGPEAPRMMLTFGAP